MAFQILPARRTGGQEFAEAFRPYLQLAFQAMMKKKLEEQQSKQAYAEATKAGLWGSNLPAMQQQIQREGGAMNIDPNLSPSEQFATAQKLFKGAGLTPPSSEYGIQSLPGMKTSFKIGANNVPEFGVETKEPSLFENITLDEEGNPALKIGEKVIPLKSLGKSTATFKTDKGADEDYVTSIKNAVEAIQSGWDANVVYQKMASAFPEKSSELKRILILQEKETLADIIRAVQGE